MLTALWIVLVNLISEKQKTVIFEKKNEQRINISGKSNSYTFQFIKYLETSKWMTHHIPLQKVSLRRDDLNRIKIIY